MYQLEVVVPKLNIRNSPVLDPTFGNWIGDCLIGEIIRASEKIEADPSQVLNEMVIDWYKDEHNRFYWAGGLQVINGQDLGTDPKTGLLNYNSLFQEIPESWAVAAGKGFTVAVIDRGFNILHKDLTGRIVATFNAADNSTDVHTVSNHGSNVAGLIAANTSTVTGIKGIAPLAKLALIKVANANDVIMPSFVKNGIAHAINELNADIINISLSLNAADYAAERDQILQLLNAATNKNILVVASAGENSRLLNTRPFILLPANEDACLAIGTVDASFLKANPLPLFNSRVSYVMPNLSLNSVADQLDGYSPIRDSSMAAAVLSGIAALAFSHKGSRIPKKDLLAMVNQHFRLFTPDISLSNLSIFKT